MARIVLGVFGLLYVVLGVWCVAAPETTSEKVGFSLVGAAGRSEFITVYGGLEIALGLFFILSGLDPSLRRAGLLLAVFTSACLAIARTATLIFVPDVPGSTYPFYAAELTMTVVAAAAFWHFRRTAAGPSVPTGHSGP